MGRETEFQKLQRYGSSSRMSKREDHSSKGGVSWGAKKASDYKAPRKANRAERRRHKRGLTKRRFKI